MRLFVERSYLYNHAALKGRLFALESVEPVLVPLTLNILRCRCLFNKVCRKPYRLANNVRGPNIDDKKCCEPLLGFYFVVTSHCTLNNQNDGRYRKDELLKVPYCGNIGSGGGRRRAWFELIRT